MALSLTGDSVPGTAPAGPQLSRGKMIFFALVMLLVSCLLLEVGLRVIMAFRVGPKVMLYGTNYYRHRGEQATAWSPDSNVQGNEGGYNKYVPNDTKYDVDEDGNKFPVAINSHGFRGHDYSTEKAPGTIRIVTLGASSTFGYYDRDTETYPYQLQKELEERVKGKAKFEVINLGIPHLTTAQILALFHAEAAPLKPDVVTFYEGINDASLTPDEAWQARKAADTVSAASQVRAKLAGVSVLRSVYRTLRDRSLAVSLFDNQIQGQLTFNRENVAQHIAGKAAMFVGNISALRDGCQQIGCTLIVMRQQARSLSIGNVKGITYEQEAAQVQKKLDETNAINHEEKAFLAHKVITDSLELWAKSVGNPYLNVKELLNNDRDVVLTWVHLSPRGNRMIAEALADEVLRDLRMDSLATR